MAFYGLGALGASADLLQADALEARADQEEAMGRPGPASDLRAMAQVIRRQHTAAFAAAQPPAPAPAPTKKWTSYLLPGAAVLVAGGLALNFLAKGPSAAVKRLNPIRGYRMRSRIRGMYANPRRKRG